MADKLMAAPNPDYGHGIFRRRVLLQTHVNNVTVELEDNNHGFKVHLQHDGKRVTDLKLDSIRHPFNTCPEASHLLYRLIPGTSLDEDEAALRRRVVPAAQCTHMYDITLLAMAHAHDAGISTVWDMEVEDERNSVTVARAYRDGKLIHAWKVAGHTLLEPTEYAGQPVLRGFYNWISEALGEASRETAIMLQRAYFVAQSRRFTFSPPEKHPAVSDNMPQGSCFSYNTGIVERAVRTEETIRDFTDSPENLLKFLP